MFIYKISRWDQNILVTVIIFVENWEPGNRSNSNFSLLLFGTYEHIIYSKHQIEIKDCSFNCPCFPHKLPAFEYLEFSYREIPGNSLQVQWLGLGIFKAKRFQRHTQTNLNWNPQ